MKRVSMPAQPIEWPAKCATCGGTARHWIPLRVTRATAPLYAGVVLMWTDVTTHARHPVCDRHRRRALVAGLMSRHTRLWLVLGVGAVMCTLAAAIGISDLLSGSPSTSLATTAGLAMISAAFWSLAIWSSFNMPVRFEAADERTFRFAFAHRGYTEEFRLANAPSGVGEALYGTVRHAPPAPSRAPASGSSRRDHRP